MKDGLHIDEHGTKRYYLNDQYHREDGPAVEYSNGTKFWLLHDQYHREDGPAVEYSDGQKEWYLHGDLHREDGPAVEYDVNGNKCWYYHGQRIDCSTNEEFLKLVKMKAFW